MTQTRRKVEMSERYGTKRKTELGLKKKLQKTKKKRELSVEGGRVV